MSIVGGVGGGLAKREWERTEGGHDNMEDVDALIWEWRSTPVFRKSVSAGGASDAVTAIQSAR
jgi:hypothetical protein